MQEIYWLQREHLRGCIERGQRETGGGAATPKGRHPKAQDSSRSLYGMAAPQADPAAPGGARCSRSCSHWWATAKHPLFAKAQTEGISLLIPEQACWTAIAGTRPMLPSFVLGSICFALVHLMNCIQLAWLKVQGSKPLPFFKHPSTPNTPDSKLSVSCLRVSHSLRNQAIRDSQSFYSVLASCWGWECLRRHCRDGQSLTHTCTRCFCLQTQIL